MADDLLGETLDGRYRVLRLLGGGAMGEVFEAEHAILGKRVAIKVLAQSCPDGRLRARFFHEARAASAVAHEHIVSVLDFGLLPTTRYPYLVMELVDGEDLDTYLDRRAPLEVPEATEIAAQLLSALSLVHAAGLVHRDVKPANIMRLHSSRARPFIKLLDFGVAGVVDPEAWHRPQLTKVAQLVGTPAYLAPEQARGGEVSPLWDLWAASIVLFEMLTGELPFRLDSLEQLQDDLAHHRLIPVERRRPGLPPWLVSIIGRGLARDPKDRFPSASAYLQALDERGERNTDDRTTPFVRVSLSTPLPELLAALGPQLKESSDRANLGSSGKLLRRPKVPELPLPSRGASDADDLPTRAVPRMDPRDLRGSDERGDVARGLGSSVGATPMALPEAPVSPPTSSRSSAPSFSAAGASDRLDASSPPRADDDVLTVAFQRVDGVDLGTRAVRPSSRQEDSLARGTPPSGAPSQGGTSPSGEEGLLRPWVILLLAGAALLCGAVATAIILAL